MSEYLDMETIYREERRRWLKEEAPRRSFRDNLTGSVPYWIILVAFVLYGLSAPHTASVFDKLTPGWGFIASVGVEFGYCMRLSGDGLPKQNRKPSPGHYGRLRHYCF